MLKSFSVPLMLTNDTFLVLLKPFYLTLQLVADLFKLLADDLVFYLLSLESLDLFSLNLYDHVLLGAEIYQFF